MWNFEKVEFSNSTTRVCSLFCFVNDSLRLLLPLCYLRELPVSYRNNRSKLITRNRNEQDISNSFVIDDKISFCLLQSLQIDIMYLIRYIYIYKIYLYVYTYILLLNNLYLLSPNEKLLSSLSFNFYASAFVPRSFMLLVISIKRN